jgi:hypothetical protein
MAHSLRALRIPRPHVAFDPAAAAGYARDRRDDLQRAWHDDPRRVMWLALWAPFWVGSDAPRPAMWGEIAADPGAIPPTPAGAWLAARIDRVTRQFRVAWMAGSILRGITLALLVLAGWSLLAILGFVGLPGWTAVVAVLGLGALVGAVHGWLVRPDRLLVAHMLDHTFGLEERIVTAFDRQADVSYLSRLQLADAANTLEEILTEVPRTTFFPIREAALCLVAAGALVTALLANVPQRPIDPVGTSPVAAFVPASERLAVRESPLPQQQVADEPTADRESLAEMQQQAREAQSAREDLATIGQALEDNPITQPAAESIANGDYAAAADSLRSAAESASQMPQGQRDSLADNLDAAADQVAETNPDLAQAARDAADALREGGPAAEEALESLADQIDNTGNQAQAPGGSPNLDESQPGGSDGTSEGQGEQGNESGSNEGNQSGNQQGEDGVASDPGEGADAAPGVQNAEQEQSNAPSQGSEGSAEEGAGSGSESGGQEPQDGQSGGAGTDQGGSGATSPEGESAGEQQGTTGAPDEETNASQGSGAGTGQTGANDQSGDSSVESPSDPQQSDPEAEVPQNGEAGDPPPSREDRGEEDDGTGTGSAGSSSIELEGSSDENIPSGGTSGSASLGSGSGSSTSSGDQGQGEVGVAGPDSNRVPDSLRDVVQDFFDGQEQP